MNKDTKETVVVERGGIRFTFSPRYDENNLISSEKTKVVLKALGKGFFSSSKGFEIIQKSTLTLNQVFGDFFFFYKRDDQEHFDDLTKALFETLTRPSGSSAAEVSIRLSAIFPGLSFMKE